MGISNEYTSHLLCRLSRPPFSSALAVIIWRGSFYMYLSIPFASVYYSILQVGFLLSFVCFLSGSQREIKIGYVFFPLLLLLSFLFGFLEQDFSIAAI